MELTGRARRRRRRSRPSAFRRPSTSARTSSRAGGRIANVGVHGKPVELHLEKLWDRNITITTRLVDTVTTPMLLKVVRSGKLQPGKLITHRFALSDIMKAYDTFGNAAKEGALKVVLTNSASR